MSSSPDGSPPALAGREGRGPAAPGNGLPGSVVPAVLDVATGRIPDFVGDRDVVDPPRFTDRLGASAARHAAGTGAR
jgi:hypothetical protein